jgi:hypothetical protein
VKAWTGFSWIITDPVMGSYEKDMNPWLLSDVCNFLNRPISFQEEIFYTKFVDQRGTKSTSICRENHGL